MFSFDSNCFWSTHIFTMLGGFQSMKLDIGVLEEVKNKKANGLWKDKSRPKQTMGYFGVAKIVDNQCTVMNQYITVDMMLYGPKQFDEHISDCYGLSSSIKWTKEHFMDGHYVFRNCQPITKEQGNTELVETICHFYRPPFNDGQPREGRMLLFMIQEDDNGQNIDQCSVDPLMIQETAVPECFPLYEKRRGEKLSLKRELGLYRSRNMERKKTFRNQISEAIKKRAAMAEAKANKEEKKTDDAKTESPEDKENKPPKIKSKKNGAKNQGKKKTYKRKTQRPGRV